MLLRSIIVSFFACITLSSCDPGISVVITNKSKADKQIRVYCLPEAVSSPCGCNSNRDSMMICPGSSCQDAFFIPVTEKDTAARVYAFALKAGYTAVIEPMHIGGAPCYGKQFIINNADTVELKQHGKDFVKTPSWSMGGVWTHTIKDK